MKNACKWAQQYGPLIGRLLLANLFIVSGFKKIGGFAGTVGYMAATMPSLDPNLIKLMLLVTIAVELGGGLLVLIGWQARWSATAILLWMIPVTYLFHAYWGCRRIRCRCNSSSSIRTWRSWVACYTSSPMGPARSVLARTTASGGYTMVVLAAEKNQAGSAKHLIHSVTQAHQFGVSLGEAP